jgi:hypothetical protein
VKDFMLLQIGGHGDKITQAERIRIKTNKSMPMQVDGEPVLLKSSEITIKHRNHAFMIQPKLEDDVDNSMTCYICSF